MMRSTETPSGPEVVDLEQIPDELPNLVNPTVAEVDA
jgi:hypothetical protein